MYFLLKNRGFLVLSWVLPPVHLFFPPVFQKTTRILPGKNNKQTTINDPMTNGTLLQACSLKALGYLFQDLGKSLGWQHDMFFVQKGQLFPKQTISLRGIAYFFDISSFCWVVIYHLSSNDKQHGIIWR